jgi:flagellar biosynthesis component FlhA
MTDSKEKVKYLMIGAVACFVIPMFYGGALVDTIFKVLAIILLAAGVFVLIVGDNFKMPSFKKQEQAENPKQSQNTESKYDNMEVMEIKQKMELEVAKKMAEAQEAKAEAMLIKHKGDLKKAKVEANRKVDILANLGVDPFGTNSQQIPPESKEYDDEEPQQPRRPPRKVKPDMLNNLKDCF